MTATEKEINRQLGSIPVIRSLKESPKIKFDPEKFEKSAKKIRPLFKSDALTNNASIAVEQSP